MIVTTDAVDDTNQVLMRRPNIEMVNATARKVVEKDVRDGIRSQPKIRAALSLVAQRHHTNFIVVISHGVWIKGTA